ncbi:hypothetical protein FB567DRAFT_549942 [Paraphoma chrysanthemicola]|uniref:Ubiquitin 3 binding protein But2 C-terminal domain-containing protein n=1 Tax=Paraphoma chrysanthemicola TaxID=798071 RepID=A0A8K0R499_9PLEO|nr:hypothetical protein FB567DRAFT_549942 [Paraphoma chrysanthemicola]
MHSFSGLLLGSAALFGFTVALPTSPLVALDRRACGTTYPTSMADVTQYGSINTNSDFCVSDTRVRYAHFIIPDSAVGACQLEFIFPANYDIANSESRQLNVWKVDRPFDTTTDTWFSAPQTTTLFGTVTLKSNPSDQSRFIVNSGDCKSMRDFKFTIAENNGGRSIVYNQQYPASGPVAGIFIWCRCIAKGNVFPTNVITGRGDND